MSIAITRDMVSRQLTAMSCAIFEIGVLRRRGRMQLREGWTSQQIEAAIRWLRHENARGAEIFVRPHGVHNLTLIDDVNVTAIAQMKKSGFEPAAILETSPANFQVWLNHGRVLDCDLSTLAAKELTGRFGGDRSSADWRHFGRLAGFTNQKKNRRLPNGLAPYVRLHEARGRTYSAASVFLEHVEALNAEARAERAKRFPVSANHSNRSIRSLHEFHRDPKYGGDLHRADMAWADYAASRGMAAEEIEREILRARDLSKKGQRRRQIAYAERTTIKAMAGIRSTHP
jgi:RepB DNA-primase N-terminal domain